MAFILTAGESLAGRDVAWTILERTGMLHKALLPASRLGRLQLLANDPANRDPGAAGGLLKPIQKFFCKT